MSDVFVSSKATATFPRFPRVNIVGGISFRSCISFQIRRMSEFICRLGTPSGEIVTRIVEAAAAEEARFQLEREGFRVFKISNAAGGLSSRPA